MFVRRNFKSIIGFFSGFPSSMLVKQIQKCSRKTVKHIVDKVRRHVFGDSVYSDIKLLLNRNNFWNEDAEKYLMRTVDICPACRHTALPQGTGKVSLKAWSRYFNALVYIDHFYLTNVTCFMLWTFSPATRLVLSFLLYHWLTPSSHLSIVG